MTRTAHFIIMGRTMRNGLKYWIAFNYELDYLIAMQKIAAQQQVSICLVSSVFINSTSLPSLMPIVVLGRGACGELLSGAEATLSLSVA
jgi:hypothetical protein